MPKQNSSSQPSSTDANAETRELLLKLLNGTVVHLIETYPNMASPETDIDDGWTAKDILGHITFWHESFARNVSALSEGLDPVPLKGRYVDLNQRSVEEVNDHPLKRVA